MENILDLWNQALAQIEKIEQTEFRDLDEINQSALTAGRYINDHGS